MTDNHPHDCAVAPALYLFPVPLADGDPRDVLPERNIRLLEGISHFVVENVRSARRFLRLASRDIVIDNLTFTELSEHTPADRVGEMLAPLAAGEAIGLLSEAGCPAVADPGALLVAEAQRRGLPVAPLVGPSSILLALMASGFNGQSFAFRGYLPIEAKDRSNAFKDMEKAVRSRRQTQIFIETPYRNNRLMEEMLRQLPSDMLLCVASDITGPRQSILTQPVSRWRHTAYDYSKIPTIFLLFS